MAPFFLDLRDPSLQAPASDCPCSFSSGPDPLAPPWAQWHLSSVSKTVHEVEKQRKRLEVEKDELQLTLEEAERALENQEAKIVFTQLELSNARQEIEARLHEKEEEFENTR